MSDHTYLTHEFESGSHILVFDDKGSFERKIFVPVSEYNPASISYVLADGFVELFVGTPEYVVKWLQRYNNEVEPKMVTVGKDFKILSVEEFKELHG